MSASQIPVRLSQHKAQNFPSYTVFKVGTSLRSNGSEFQIIGCGCHGERGDQASAYYELLERLYAQYEVVRQRTSHNDLIIYSWLDRREIGRISFEKACLGAPTPHFIDGTGLAYGPTLDHALEHGANELLERQLCVGVWYHGEKLQCVREDISSGTLPICFYKLVRPMRESFSLASIYDSKNEVYVAGSAVRMDERAAASHAAEEAIMLYDSVISGSRPHYRNALSQEHFLSLRGEKSRLRANWMRQLAMPTTGTATVGDLSGLADRVGLENLRYIVFNDVDGNYVVRVFAENAQTPAMMRQSGRAPSDPFC